MKQYNIMGGIDTTATIQMDEINSMYHAYLNIDGVTYHVVEKTFEEAMESLIKKYSECES